MSPRPRTRRPTTPGEILREEFLKPLKLTQKTLADHVGCDIKVINRIVNGARVRFTCPDNHTPYIPGQHGCPVCGVKNIEYIAVEKTAKE